MEPMSDDEVRALGYEPTPKGWVPLFRSVELRLQDAEWHRNNGYKRRCPRAGTPVCSLEDRP
jgi:hypothetical protein